MSARTDPMDLPLEGVRLVEASAGTGKTFTIATLYLRLILERALTPEQIVVATFTRAATAELAMRLRKRLRLAAELLRGDDPARARHDDDGETEAARKVIGRALDTADAATLARRARDAELAMDTAMIGTLHGFCNRVLGEFGFETGHAPGGPELLEDSRALEQEVVEDFWRSCSTDAEASRLLAETWRTPDALAGQVCDPRWRGRDPVVGDDARMPDEARRAQREEAIARLDAIRNSIAGWDEHVLQGAAEEIAECIHHKIACNSRVQGLHALREWAQAGTAPELLSARARKAIDDLDKDKLADLKSCKHLPHGPVFDAIADLAMNTDALRRLDDAARARLLLDARAYLERELPLRMRSLGVLGHDQTLDELAAALDEPQRGARAVRAIRERWPVALVDEFQDTDPKQWHILKTLFAHQGGTLVLVGDPKQAIYGFRGGDVHVWLLAKRETQCEPLRLDESQRAGDGVTAAVNALFSRNGAFIEEGIVHENVHSAPRVAQRALLVDGAPMPGVRIWRLPVSGTTAKGTPKLHGKGEAQSDIEAACVAQIVDWLDGAGQDRVQLREADGSTRELCARDIAVLVNSNREARSMQRALTHAGVPAASCLRASVYASEEAADLRLVLEALRDPADAARARAARASLLIGDDAHLIARTRSDGAALDALLMETSAWAAWMVRSGPLPLLHRLIGLAAPRLLGTAGGDRRIANYLQLAELLQRDHAMCFGIEDLCERYTRALRENAADTDAEAVRLRLDTDREAVQIATVHAAKGLEYSVVLLPCTASGRTARNHGKKPALAWYHEGDAARVAVDGDIAPEVAELAQREELAEEVRKLYVAVTRARAAFVLPWGCVKQADATAMHQLLYVAGRDTPLAFDEPACDQALAEPVARGRGHIAVEPLPAASSQRLSKPRAEDAPPVAAEFHGTLERDWRIWSFSRLVRATHAGAADPAPGSGDAPSPAAESYTVTTAHHSSASPLGVEGRDDGDSAPSAASVESSTAGHGSSPSPPWGEGWGEGAAGWREVAGIHPQDFGAVLAGARFGSAVHAALERADFPAWRDASTLPETQRSLIERSLRAEGLPDAGSVSMERAISLVADCMRGALNVRLVCGTRLCDVPPERRCTEMEFHLRLAPSRVDALLKLLHAHGYQQGRSGFGIARLHGLLTGVMDLVFEHDGRYHLIDYKTNLLAAYDADALREAITAHDYDLQYLLYTLALHRWLRQVLPGYDYDTRVGDVYYLFVRDLTEGRGVHRDRPARALIDAMDALMDLPGARAA